MVFGHFQYEARAVLAQRCDNKQVLEAARATVRASTMRSARSKMTVLRKFDSVRVNRSTATILGSAAPALGSVFHMLADLKTRSLARSSLVANFSTSSRVLSIGSDASGRGGSLPIYIGMATNLQLTDEETAALVRELHDLV